MKFEWEGPTGAPKPWAVQGSWWDGESSTVGLAMAPISPMHSKLDTKCFSPIFQLISPPRVQGC